MKHTIHLALGSNLGDRKANLEAAMHALPPACRLRAVSSIYETAPWGVTDQPGFLNMAVEATTRLKPLPLLMHLKEIEQALGRIPSVRWGPRLIDMDILFYDDRVIELPEVTIPHPRMHERGFVLVPLADIAPDFVHPVLGRTVRSLAEAVGKEGIVPYGS